MTSSPQHNQNQQEILHSNESNKQKLDWKEKRKKNPFDAPAGGLMIEFVEIMKKGKSGLRGRELQGNTGLGL